MPDGCPDENTIARFAEDLLPDEDRRALGEHIDSCPSCGLLMAELARVLRTPGAPASSRPPTSETVSRRAIPRGTAVGRYILERELGSGGMGDVYLAQDPTLGRRVAVKLVRPAATGGIGAAEARDRLVREARAMAQVAHPHVVPVFDSGAFGEQVFVAMEYVEGRTVAEWLAAAPRPWQEVVARFVEAGLGLAAAHKRGILHRDVKPSNLLVGDDGRTRVTDFGLARPGPARDADLEGAEGEDLTRAGAVVGTPAYMAPEQLWGKSVDARGDQFGLAASLYEALFGERPFRGTTLDELRASTTGDAPWPASTRGVPEAVTHVVLRGLATSADQRYPTMDAFVSALRQSATQGAEGHVRMNAMLQAIACPLHVLITVHLFGKIAKPPVPVDDSSPLIGFILVIYMMVVLGWLVFGIVWAPMNAWGLWHHKRWARGSSLVYATLAIPSLIAAPYGIYALWSLSRPEVKATFR